MWFRDRPYSRIHDHEKILNLWAEGVKGLAIAAEVGCTDSTVRSVIARARQHGDPRAAVRPRRRAA